MKVKYDPEVDVPSIILSDAPVEENHQDKPGVILDYGKDGNVVALEVLDRSSRCLPNRVSSLPGEST